MNRCKCPDCDFHEIKWRQHWCFLKGEGAIDKCASYSRQIKIFRQSKDQLGMTFLLLVVMAVVMWYMLNSVIVTVATITAIIGSIPVFINSSRNIELKCQIPKCNYSSNDVKEYENHLRIHRGSAYRYSIW